MASIAAEAGRIGAGVVEEQAGVVAALAVVGALSVVDQLRAHVAPGGIARAVEHIARVIRHHADAAELVRR